MPVGPLGQLFPDTASLVAMAPLLRGLGLMGTRAWSPWRGAAMAPFPGLQSSVSSLRRSMGLWGL